MLFSTVQSQPTRYVVSIRLDELTDKSLMWFLFFPDSIKSSWWPLTRATSTSWTVKSVTMPRTLQGLRPSRWEEEAERRGTGLGGDWGASTIHWAVDCLFWEWLLGFQLEGYITTGFCRRRNIMETDDLRYRWCNSLISLFGVIYMFCLFTYLRILGLW